MRWVKETLPPRARDRWLLMTMRLSQSSLTGTDRTEVAVGTLRESSMLATVRAGAPRSTVYVGWSLAAAGVGDSFSFGTGRSVPLAGSAALLSGRGAACGDGFVRVSVVVFSAGAFEGGAAFSTVVAFPPVVAFGAGGCAAGFSVGADAAFARS